MQCYDQYLLKSLKKTAEARGHPCWARGPENAGTYNTQPHETGFFCDGGDYDVYYGRFFLNWYSRILVEHGDRVLSLAKLAFEGTQISAKVSKLFHIYFKEKKTRDEIFILFQIKNSNKALFLSLFPFQSLSLQNFSRLILELLKLILNFF